MYMYMYIHVHVYNFPNPSCNWVSSKLETVGDSCLLLWYMNDAPSHGIHDVHVHVHVICTRTYVDSIFFSWEYYMVVLCLWQQQYHNTVKPV